MAANLKIKCGFTPFVTWIGVSHSPDGATVTPPSLLLYSYASDLPIGDVLKKGNYLDLFTDFMLFYLSGDVL